jgi:hypothetical protein
VVLEWQVSQAAVVGTCAEDFPVGVIPLKTVLPLWQVTQVPGVIPMEWNLAPLKVVKLVVVVAVWHTSHAADVGT